MKYKIIKLYQLRFFCICIHCDLRREIVTFWQKVVFRGTKKMSFSLFVQNPIHFASTKYMTKQILNFKKNWSDRSFLNKHESKLHIFI